MSREEHLFTQRIFVGRQLFSPFNTHTIKCDIIGSIPYTVLFGISFVMIIHGFNSVLLYAENLLNVVEVRTIGW